jgi:hypothetical protein
VTKPVTINQNRLLTAPNLLFWIALGGFGIGSMLFLYWLTPHGPGLSPDSMSYLVGARNILLGRGYTVTGSPETHFPPLYSLAIAIVRILEKDLLQAARILNSVIFGLNIMGSMGLVYLATRRNMPAAVLAATTMLVSFPFARWHAMALSEPLFIFFSLLCILFLGLFISKQSRITLVFSSLCLSFCILTRYIGASYIPVAVGIVFFLTSARTLGLKWGNILLYLLGTGFLPGLFFLYNWLSASEVTDRSLVFHPINPLEYIQTIYLEICKFLMPFPVFQIGLSAVITILLVLLITLALRKTRPTMLSIDWGESANWVALLTFLFSAAYLSFLFISITYFDALTPVNQRLLLPVFAFFLIGIFPTVMKATLVLNKPTLWNAFLLFFMLMVVIKTPVLYTQVGNLRKKSLGYQIHDIDHSKIVAIAKHTPRVVKIYSNSTDVLRFLVDRKIDSLPYIIFPTTALNNPNYKQELDSICNELSRKEAIIVFLKVGVFRPYFPKIADLQLACSRSKSTTFPDGFILGSYKE